MEPTQTGDELQKWSLCILELRSITCSLEDIMRSIGRFLLMYQALGH